MAVDENGEQYYRPVAGLYNVGSYQASSIPFLTSSVPLTNSEPVTINFPSITKSIIVKNLSYAPMRIGFSYNGVKGNNYFIIESKEAFGMDFKSTAMYLMAHTATPCTASVMAGVTGIPLSELTTNWSGSSGVG